MNRKFEFPPPAVSQTFPGLVPGEIPDVGALLCRCRYILHPIREIRRPGLWRDRRELISPDWGFWYILRGSGAVVLDGKKYPIRVGDLYTFRPGQKVRGEVTDPKGARFFTMHWMPLDGHSMAALDFAIRLNDDNRALEKLWLEAFQNEDNGHPASHTSLPRHGFFFRLLHGMVRLGGVSIHPGFGKGHDYNGLLDMMDHLSKHLDRPFSLPVLASQFGMDPSSINRRWKRHLATSPARWFREQRLEHGRTLLDIGESVSSVARQCGYPDPFTFSKAFKKRYEKSPTAYVRERRVPPETEITS